MYNSVFPLYDWKGKLLLAFLLLWGQLLKAGGKEAVKVKKVDFDVVPQVALWDELNVKASKQQRREKKE